MKKVKFDIYKNFVYKNMSGDYGPYISGNATFNAVVDKNPLVISGLYKLEQSNKTGERYYVSGELTKEELLNNKYQNSYKSNNGYYFPEHG